MNTRIRMGSVVRSALVSPLIPARNYREVQLGHVSDQSRPRGITRSSRAFSDRLLAWVLAAVALAAVGGAIFGFWQKNEAEIRRHDAEVPKAEAKRQEAIANENANREKIARDAAEAQARIAESRRLAAESSSALTKYPQRSLLLAVEAVKVVQPLQGMRLAADEQSLREALDFIGGRLVAKADEEVSAVAISPDNRWVVTGSEDKTARLWDLSANDPAANAVVLRGHDEQVVAVAISPDSRWLVTGSKDKTARLWDLSARDPAAIHAVLRGHEEDVNRVAISPDSRWVVTGSSDKTARLWNLSAKDPATNPVVLRGHDGAISAVAISPDSRWVVTGSEDKTARIWNLSVKDPAANPVVLRHEAEVWAVAISSDNRWLVTGSSDNTARLWLLQVNDLVDLARTVVGRNFSADEWRLYFPGEKYRKTFPDLPGPD